MGCIGTDRYDSDNWITKPTIQKCIFSSFVKVLIWVDNILFRMQSPKFRSIEDLDIWNPISVSFLILCVDILSHLTVMIKN